MGERRVSAIERLLHRIEDRVERWREQDRAHKAEAAKGREKLWAEATERERLLAEALAGEKHRQGSPGASTEEHRVVFVAHTGEAARTLEAFARERGRLVDVVPGRGSSGEGTNIQGSWLVFEAPEP